VATLVRTQITVKNAALIPKKMIPAAMAGNKAMTTSRMMVPVLWGALMCGDDETVNNCSFMIPDSP
jgi:hypothetical protein